MERREFLSFTGKAITAAFFINYFGMPDSKASTEAISGHNPDNKSKRPNYNKYDSAILKAIAIGLNAPSPHNTQSWKFKILNETEMLFYVDEHKLLPATDPPSRQIHIGAGCFIETLAIGISSIGYESNVQYFPEGYNTSSDFGIKPVAKIVLHKKSDAINPLSNFIPLRQTNRSSYKGNLITTEEFISLEKEMGKIHSRFSYINNLEIMTEYKELFYKAFEIETLTYKTSEETRKMFRFSETERKEKGDGLSIPQMGYKGLIEHIAENSLKNGNEKIWHSNRSNNSVLKNFKRGIESSKGLIFFTTTDNNYIDWIESGRDFVKFSLACTKNNFYLHPCNQAIQEYDEMKNIREKLNQLQNISGNQKIQMIARIGRADTPYFSYRKELENYIIK